MTNVVYVAAKNEPAAILLAQRKFASNEDQLNNNRSCWLQYAYNNKPIWAVTFTQGGYICSQIKPE
jgi:hypothetical protein